PVAGSVRWEERSPNVLRLSVTSDRPALLVVADNWFPAWRATVDGADAPVLRAYHTLRAVPVPAGSHTVEMRYHSALLVRSMWVSILALGCLVALGVLGTLAERRRAA
ncbi:MAG TPA: YfhO family protein, partial [Longimicrobiales bacterium]|nr:YfhO family protein [Longimicrobiales bacterium]